MGLSTRRKNQKAGRTSNVMIIPAGLEVGEESSIAANRLILADPRGEIDEKKLLKFLEKNLEPDFWEWYSQKQKAEEAGKSDSST